MPKRLGAMLERFWALVDRQGPDDCWPWLGTLDRGYGIFYTGRFQGRAHITAYMLAHGNLDSSEDEVSHSCSERSCMNPAHLIARPKKANATPEGRRDYLRRRLKGRITENAESCWIIRAVRGDDYGKIKLDGRFIPASRAAYEAFVGPVGEGLEVCHRCNVKRCVNPDHLYLGTHAENMRDAGRDGLISRGLLAKRRTLPGEGKETT